MDRIYLVGAQEVASAGSQMARAAADMQQAAANIGGHLDQHQRQLAELLDSHARAMDRFTDSLHVFADRLDPPKLLQVEEPPTVIEPAPPRPRDPNQCPLDTECSLGKGHPGKCDIIPF